MIDLNNLTFISISEIPPKRIDKIKFWTELFDAIPKEKAAVLKQGEPLNYASAQQALRYRHKKGKFKDYRVVKRGDTFYIVHQKVKKQK